MDGQILIPGPDLHKDLSRQIMMQMMETELKYWKIGMMYLLITFLPFLIILNYRVLSRTVMWRDLKAMRLTRSIKKDQQNLKSSKLPLERFDQRQDPDVSPIGNWCDSFSFQGSTGSLEGPMIFTRLGLRKGRTEGWVFLSLPDVGLLTFETQSLISKSSTTIETEPLQFKCVEPLRKWELKYSGTCKGNEKSHKVEFNLTFLNINSMFNGDMDYSATAIGRAFAPLPWAKTFFPNMKKHHQHQHFQVGRLEGSIIVDSKEYPVQTFGNREHSYGGFDWGYYIRSLSISVPLWKNNSNKTAQPDASLQLSLIEHPLAPTLTLGHFWQKEKGNIAIDEATRLVKIEHSETVAPPEAFQMQFWVGKTVYDVFIKIQTKFELEMDKRTMVYERIAQIKVTSSSEEYEGVGWVEFTLGPKQRAKFRTNKEVRIKKRNPLRRTQDIGEPTLKEISTLNTNPSFTLRDVGTNILAISKLISQGHKVPFSFCVPAFFYDEFLKSTNVSSLIEKIESHQIPRDEVYSSSKKIQGKILETEFSENFTKALEQIYAPLEKKTFSVHSSVTNDQDPNFSVKNIKDFASLQTSLKQVWASVWSPSAVLKRLERNFPSSHVSVAVLVQEAATEENTLSGIVHSADSDNENLSSIYYVSGNDRNEAHYEEKWDSVTISKSENRVIARKNFPGKGKEGILEEKLALHICDLVKKIENSQKSPVLLEISITNNDVWIHHIKPLPLAPPKPNMETMEAFSKEFDTVLQHQDHLYTKFGIGELLPEGICPLSRSVMVDVLDSGIQALGFVDISSTNHYLKSHYGHVFLDYSALGALVARSPGLKLEALEYSLTGISPKISAVKPEGVPNPLSTLQPSSTGYYFNLFKVALLTRRSLKQLVNLVCNFPVLEEKRKGDIDSLELYQTIDKLLPELSKACQLYARCSAHYGVWMNVIMGLLGYSETSKKILVEIGRNIGDLPSYQTIAAVQNLARDFQENSKMTEILLENSNEFSYEKLKTDPDFHELHMKFLHFLRYHGHRGSVEMDFHSKSWAQNPKQLLSILKLFIMGQSEPLKFQRKSLDQLLSELSEEAKKKKDALSSTQQRLFRFAVDQLRKGIEYRDKASNLMTKCTSYFKEFYGLLAQLMVLEGYLEDEDQLFYFSHYEVDTILRFTTQARDLFLAMARKRRENSAGWTFGVLPEVYGVPVPKKEVENVEEQWKGTAVGQVGTVTGVVRKCTTTHDVDFFQPGEILLVPQAELRWTVLLPLATGFICENAGLLSHAAIISQEMDIPAIIGVKNIIEKVNSGDIVEIDTKTGFITLIKKSNGMKLK